MSNEFDIQSRITIHDRNKVEIKLGYNIGQIEKQNSFRIELFFFIPDSLALRKVNYDRDRFYGDLTDNIRFSSPVMTLAQLNDPACARSPLSMLRGAFDGLAKEFSERLKLKVINELQVLGVIFRSRWLHEGMEICESPVDGLEHFTALIDESEKLIHTFRDLKQQFSGSFPTLKEDSAGFQALDEYLSCLFEEGAVQLFSELRAAHGRDERYNALYERFRTMMDEEYTYRKKEKFQFALLDTEQSRERYIYFTGLFKKFVSSVLYLDTVKRKDILNVQHIIGGFAAFLAAVFAFLAAAVINPKYRIDSFTFIFLSSISYVFKDRIKDAIKWTFNPFLLSRFPDYQTTIIDNYMDEKVDIGWVREKADFLRKEELDPMALTLREKTRRNEILPQGLNETIIRYQKEISINPKEIVKRHSRTLDITDVMRYNMSDFFPRMDEPRESLFLYNPVTRSIEQSQGRRVYYINIILKRSVFRGSNTRIEYERHRVVLDKKGIVRLEKVE